MPFASRKSKALKNKKEKTDSDEYQQQPKLIANNKSQNAFENNNNNTYLNANRTAFGNLDRPLQQIDHNSKTNTTNGSAKREIKIETSDMEVFGVGSEKSIVRNPSQNDCSSTISTKTTQTTTKIIKQNQKHFNFTNTSNAQIKQTAQKTSTAQKHQPYSASLVNNGFGFGFDLRGGEVDNQLTYIVNVQPNGDAARKGLADGMFHFFLFEYFKQFNKSSNKIYALVILNPNLES